MQNITYANFALIFISLLLSLVRRHSAKITVHDHLSVSSTETDEEKNSVFPLDDDKVSMNEDDIHSPDIPPADCGCSERTSRSEYATAADDTSGTLFTATVAATMTVDVNPAAIDTDKDMLSSDGNTMVVIPEGTFFFGTDNPKIPYDNEGPKIKMQMRSFLIDKYEVSNSEFKQFVLNTSYVTESEAFGWSFVIETAIPPSILKGISEAVLGAEWWLPVNGAFWYQPEGPGTDVFSNDNYRGDHAVTQVGFNFVE